MANVTTRPEGVRKPLRGRTDGTYTPLTAAALPAPAVAEAVAEAVSDAAPAAAEAVVMVEAVAMVNPPWPSTCTLLSITRSG